MATPTLVFDVQTKGLAAKLKALQGATGNMTPVFRTVGSVVANRVRLCFKLGIDPWGAPWKPIKFRAARRTDNGAKLSKAGRAQVQANAGGGAGQPLRDTGRLMRSIVSKADATGATIGTNLKVSHKGRTHSLGAIHQFGAVVRPRSAPMLVFPGPNGAMVFAKRSVIPARPFLPIKTPGAPVVLPVQWSAAVSRTLRAYFKAAAEKAVA